MTREEERFLQAIRDPEKKKAVIQILIDAGCLPEDFAKE